MAGAAAAALSPTADGLAAAAAATAACGLFPLQAAAVVKDAGTAATFVVVIARGRIPFHARAPKEEDPLHDVWEILAYIFLAGISHDLATPLTAIKGYASGILDGIAKSPEKERLYIEQIHESACLMENMVENLFLFSKLDLKKIPFHLEEVALADYLADFARDRSDLFAVRGLTLSCSSDGRPCRAAIDRTQFPRVLENFLENSIKYRREDVPAALHIHVEEAEETVRLSFTDNGQGVPEEALVKLFDTFYRTDRARTDTSKGSGLGLAIAREIVCACHGTIHAEANPAGGLILKIILPRQKETTEERRGDA